MHGFQQRRESVAILHVGGRDLAFDGLTAQSRSSDPAVADNRLQPFIPLDKGGACDDSGDQAVDCADADKIFIPRAAQDEIKLLVG